MSKKNKRIKIFLMAVIVIAFASPYLLHIAILKKIVCNWLLFTENSDYIVAYVELLGGIFGTFLSVYGALFIQREQQEKQEKIKSRMSARRIYIELKTCLNQLLNIFKEGKNLYENGCITSDKRKLLWKSVVGRNISLSTKWVNNLADVGDIFSEFEIDVIYKYYVKLQIIQNALETKNEKEIEKIYTEYVCWFISLDGTHLHNDIKEFLEKLDKITHM